MRLLPAALSAIRRLPKKELADRTIAESLTEQCGHKTFQIVWVLGGLRATRTLPALFRFESVEGGANGGIDDIPGTSAAALMSNQR
jgi:hypothetical protein